MTREEKTDKQKWQLFKSYQLHALAFALNAAQRVMATPTTIDVCALLKTEINSEIRRRARQARKAHGEGNR